MAKLDSRSDSAGKKLDFGAPIGMINSSRVILHRPDRSTVVMRRGKNGLLGLVGGKIHYLESSRGAATREVSEETGLELSGVVRLEGALKAYGRKIWYPIWKFRGLGFAFPHDGDDNDLVQLWNPRAELYSGLTLTELTNGIVEGRDVVEVDLTKENSLELIKPRHRGVLKAWRKFVLEGVPFPNEFIWEEKGPA